MSVTNNLELLELFLQSPGDGLGFAEGRFAREAVPKVLFVLRVAEVLLPAQVHRLFPLRLPCHLVEPKGAPPVPTHPLPSQGGGLVPPHLPSVLVAARARAPQREHEERHESRSVTRPTKASTRLLTPLPGEEEIFGKCFGCGMT